MKLIIIGLFLNSMMALASTQCADFSGTWMGSCRGKEPGVGGPTEILIKQNSCKTLFFIDTTVLVDGKWHPAGEGARYLAQWNREIDPEGDRLEVNYESPFEGIVFKVEYALVQSQEGRQVVIRSSTREVLGSEEPLETCSFRRK